MKRILLLLLFIFISTLDISAQEQIWLPIITKDGDCEMKNNSILEISDGTTTINLLPTTSAGFHVESWRPQVINLKGGGIYQNSSIAPGRQLVFGVDEDVTETFNMVIDGDDQNATIDNLQNLMRLFVKARNYWLTTWQDEPVWIAARSGCEDNIRYAIIKNYNIPQLDNPYAQPFATGFDLASIADFTVAIERGHWLSNIPGESDCVETNNQVDLLYAELETNTTLPNNQARAILQVTNDDIYASGGVRLIIRTQDNGASWASNLAGLPLSVTALVNHFLQLQNGYILAGSSEELIRTTDGGASWTQVDALDTRDIIQVSSTGTIIACGENGVIYSNDNGGSWNTSTIPSGTRYNSLVEASDGSLLVIGWNGIVYESNDDGVTWSPNGFEFPIQDSSDFNANIMKVLSDDNIYLIDTSSASSNRHAELWKSTDNGLSFTKIFDYHNLVTNSGSTSGHNIIEDINTNGVFYALVTGDELNLVVSYDYGQSFGVLTPIPSSSATASGVKMGLEQAANTKLYIGGVGDIYRLDLNEITVVGRSNTCKNEVYFVNKENLAGLTDIKIDDSGIFTDIFPISVYPQLLLPAVPAVNDALYLGNNSSSVYNGTFSNAVLDIDTPLSGSITLVWEYWNGAWVTLTLTDNTNTLKSIDVNSIHFEPPSDWATTAVDGVTGYWIRARVSATSGTVTSPTQQNRDIYTLNNSNIDIDYLNNLLGDIAAVAQHNLFNQSDFDGPGGDSPDLFSNRVITGLRTIDRGTNFTSFINLSDEQTQTGLNITVGTNTTFVNDLRAPTGVMAQYNPGGVEAMATRASISLSSNIARDFYGTYHAFLRVQRTAGSQSDFDVQLQVSSGSGGVTKTTDSVQVETTTKFELLDFGQITIPAAGNLTNNEIGDETIINIQASAASGTPNLNLYDLILIPTDEWSIDSNDKANEDDSDIGRSNEIQKYLDIDSITSPKNTIRSLVKESSSDFVTAIYNSISVGEAILQANADQRLWFLAAQTSATGSSFSWIAPPEISHSVQLFKNQRYLGLRGVG